jgi:hypothetical protein
LNALSNICFEVQNTYSRKIAILSNWFLSISKNKWMWTSDINEYCSALKIKKKPIECTIFKILFFVKWVSIQQIIPRFIKMKNYITLMKIRDVPFTFIKSACNFSFLCIGTICIWREYLFLHNKIKFSRWFTLCCLLEFRYDHTNPPMIIELNIYTITDVNIGIF